jgi:tetratricopeptide (TPR) repeat protein
MAAAEQPKNDDWKKKESFGSALVQVAVVALLLVGAVFFFYQRNVTKKNVAEKYKEARAIALRDNPADLAKALGLYEESLKFDSSNPEVLASVSAVQTEQWLVHRIAGAEAKAKESLAKASGADRSEDLYGTRALQQIADGKAKEAFDGIEALRKRGAGSPKMAFAQASALKALGQLKLAKPMFQSVVDKAWKDPQYSSAYGESLLDEGQWLQALDAFNKATSANPEHLRARLGSALGKVFRRDRVKDADDLVKELEPQADSLSPFLKGRLFTVKAELANLEGRYDDAKALAEQAVAANGEDPWGLFAKGRALAGKKDVAAAQAFQAAIAKAPTSPIFYWDGAAALQQAGELAPALTLLDQYEAKFKDVRYPGADGKDEAHLERDDRYWIARGEVLQASGKLDDSLAAYDKAIAAKNVNIIKARYARASALIAKKDIDNALKELADITPPDGTGVIPEAYLAVGNILFDKKSFPEACQNFAFALTKFKGNQVSREKLNEIVSDVEKRLIKEGQKNIAKAWAEEAKPLIQ